MEQQVSGRQLIGDGCSVEFTDGSKINLKVDHRAMVKVEEVFGSLADMIRELGHGTDGPIWGSTVKAIWCLAQHLPEWRGEDAQERLMDLMDHSKVLDDYRETITEVILEGFPHLAQRKQEITEAVEKTMENLTQSPGQIFTQPEDDISDLAMTNSGV